MNENLTSLDFMLVYMLLMHDLTTYTFYLPGLSVESCGEGIVVSSVEEGRLAHVQGRLGSTTGFVKRKLKRFGEELQ